MFNEMICLSRKLYTTHSDKIFTKDEAEEKPAAMMGVLGYWVGFYILAVSLLIW